MPNWKKVLVSGSDANIRQLTLGASGTTYTLPTTTGSQGEILVTQADGNLQFGSVVGALNGGTISSSAQIAALGFVNEVGNHSLTGSFNISSSGADANITLMSDQNVDIQGNNIRVMGLPFGPTNEIQETTLQVTGSIDASGIAIFRGGVVFGDGQVDALGIPDFITFNSLINSNLIPSQSNTFDIGSGSLRWNTGYINNISASGINVSTGTLSIPGYSDVSSSLADIQGGNITLPANIVSSSAQTINNLSGSTVFVDTIHIGRPGEYTTTTALVTGSLNVSGALVVNGNIENIGRISTTDDMRSVFVGNAAGEKENPGYRYNTGIGYATMGEVTTGLRNVGLGFQSVGFVTTGNDNIGIGYFGGLGVITGAENVAIGTETLGGDFANGTDRSENVAIGHHALRLAQTSRNTAVGALAGDNMTTGNLNTTLGWRAGSNISTGGQNVAIGANAGYLNMNGDENIVIGYNTALSQSNNDNNIIIGAGTIGRGSNTTTIGNSSTVSTKLYGTLEIDGIANVSQSIADIEAGDITLPEGVISSSAQIDNLFDIDGLVSSSAQIEALGFISSSTSVVSSSAQIDFNSIQNNSNIVSSSAQIDFTSIQNTANIVSSSTQLATAISGAFDSTSASLADSISAATASIADFVNGNINAATASYSLTASLLEGKALMTDASQNLQYQVLLQGQGTDSTRDFGPASGSFFSVNPLQQLVTTRHISASGDVVVSGDLSFANPQNIDFSAGLGGSVTSSNMLVKNNFTVMGVFTAENLNATASKALQVGTSSFMAGNDIPVLMGLDADSDGYVNIAADEANLTYNGLRLLVPSLTASGDSRVQGDLVVTGNINASAIHTTYVTSSVSFYSSSNKFGDETSDTHEFTGSVHVTTNVSASNLYIADTGSISWLNIMDQVQLNGQGSQYFAYNEDTVKVKFANWYNSNANQFGQTQLWHELAFLAINPTNHRRISFYLDTPDSGSTDSLSGVHQSHASNAAGFFNQDGLYIANNLVVTGSITGDGSGITGVAADSVTFANVTNKPTLLSSSNQIATEVSGAFDELSGSIATRFDGLTSDYTELTNIPSGILSSSVQVNDILQTNSQSLDLGTGVISASRAHIATDLDAEGSATIDGTITLGTSGIIQSTNAITVQSTNNTANVTDVQISALGANGSVGIQGGTDVHINTADNVNNGTTIIGSIAQNNIALRGSTTFSSTVFFSNTGNAPSGQVLTTGVGGLLSLTDTITNATSASYISSSNIDGDIVATEVPFNSITGRPTLLSSSAQVDYSELQNIPSGLISSSAQIDDLFDIDGLVSSSDQVVAHLPAGTISSSAQIDNLFNQDGVVSSSAQISALGFISSSVAVVSSSAQIDFAQISNRNGVVSSSAQVVAHLPNNTVSSSTQVSYAGLQSIPGNIVSSSDQIKIGLPSGTISSSAQIDNLFNQDGVVSSSAQIDAFGFISSSVSVVSSSAQIDFTQITNTAGIVSSSTQVVNHLPSDTVSSSAQVVNFLPAGTVSGSGQIDELFNIDGIISSSAQFTDINAPFTGSFTGSFVGDGSGLTGVGSVQNGILFGLGLLGGTYNGILSVTSSLNTSSAHFQEGAAAAIGSSSFASRIDTFEGKSLFSSSAQVTYGSISSIPEGIISSSGQIDELFNLDGIISSSDQIATQISGAFDLVSESIASDIAGNFNNGIVTASANLNVITFTEGDESTFNITINTGSLPAGVVTSSAQVDFTEITNTANIVSSSAQITYSDVSSIPTGIVSSSAQINSLIAEGGALPAGVVSASAEGTVQGQITLNGNAVDVNALGTGDSPTFNNLTVTGNLTTTGTVTNINSTDLSIEDKFILLNSGSSTGNSGFVVQTGATNGVGTALFYNDSANRWSFDNDGANANTDTVTADAHVAAIANSNTDTNYQNNGNIYVDGTDVFIWVE
jgi:hypothetical protein